MRVLLILTFVLLSACAGSFDRVRELREQAPDWYAARKVEIAGEAYPRIRNIPILELEANERSNAPLTREEIDAAQARFSESDRASPPEETPEDLQAWVAGIQEELSANVPEADFLTEEDIQALKERFDVPRARL